MKKKVKVTYEFEIQYDHENQLKNIIGQLKDEPIFEMFGACMIKNKAYSYGCKRLGKGILLK